jgi:glyoxylase-like metal-dependent hydrolase (beta-lactamase superfamily II)
MKRVHALAIAALLVFAQAAQAQTASGSLDAKWSEGAQDCKAHFEPPLQVHRYNATTYILREDLCSTFEAPFMYLLIGQKRALLIDTGDVADPKAMPLAKTVTALLPHGLPLLVVHTHRHMDHRAGDPQFATLPNVQVVGYDIDSVKRFYNFTPWPEGVAQVDLGERVIVVLPTPGHNETEVSFYDRNTALFFSGDFLMPGRLLVDDASAYVASANRAVAFLKDKPVRAILAGHIEMTADGGLEPWESQYHPNERALPMTKADLLALPAALAGFNGFYLQSGKFTMINSLNILDVGGIGVLIVIAGLIWFLTRFFRRRRRAHLA